MGRDTVADYEGERMRVAVMALLLGVGLTGCHTLTPPAVAPLVPPGWTLSTLPGGPQGPVLDLWRPARTPPARWRVIVLPGSGCTGWAPLAERYTAGLRHAEVHLLHKPRAHPGAGPAPSVCPSDFEATDTLPRWAEAARQAVAALGAGEGRPTWLVGVSEGGELLPVVAPVVQSLVGVVLLSSPGLDPVDAARLQARRQGVEPAWQAVEQAAQSDRPDTEFVEGRPLRYWRALMHWRVAAPLLAQRVPVWQVWGSADPALPPAAYEAFAEQARPVLGRHFCSWRLDGYDHGLQHPKGRDGLQALWRRLDADLQPACPSP